LPDLPFEKISTPTLIVHGTADKCVPFSEAEAVARRVPGAILFPVQGAGHLVEIGPWAAGVQSRIGDFLRQYSGRSSPP
jgi:pimeloyl-ACP methyl ester carboxylesterase